jgi:hypothetical protein
VTSAWTETPATATKIKDLYARTASMTEPRASISGTRRDLGLGRTLPLILHHTFCERCELNYSHTRRQYCHPRYNSYLCRPGSSTCLEGKISASQDVIIVILSPSSLLSVPREPIDGLVNHYGNLPNPRISSRRPNTHLWRVLIMMSRIRERRSKSMHASGPFSVRMKKTVSGLPALKQSTPRSALAIRHQ